MFLSVRLPVNQHHWVGVLASSILSLHVTSQTSCMPASVYLISNMMLV